jgi:hypothetical protein
MSEWTIVSYGASCAAQVWYVWGRVLGKLPNTQAGDDVPNNVPNVVDVVSVVARENARNVSRHRFKHQRPGRSHQRLRSRNQAR